MVVVYDYISDSLSSVVQDVLYNVGVDVSAGRVIRVST